MKSILTCLLMVPLLLACNANTQIRGEVKEKDAKSGDQQPADGENEGASAPNIVTGAALTCPIVESNEQIEVSVVCRYVDKANKPVPLSSLAKEAKFEAVGALPPEVTISQVIFADEAGVGATYSLLGPNFATILGAISNLEFKAQLVEPRDPALKSDWSGKGSEVTTPPVVRWVIHKASDTNKNGICDAGETCIYEGNGLMWLADDGIARGNVNASRGCQDLENIYTDWSLPRDSRMKIAFEKGIWAHAADLNLVASPYWANNGYVPGTGNPDAIFAVDMSTGLKTDHSIIENLRSVCVRPL